MGKHFMPLELIAINQNQKLNELGGILNQWLELITEFSIGLLKEVNSVFLGTDFITVKKTEQVLCNKIKPGIISLINDYYLNGNEIVLKKNQIKEEVKDELNSEVEKKIVEILDSKIRPAVARDGGDIKFKSFKDGLVIVELQGSCSGCPSSVMTLKQGVENLLCHYVPEVKKVEAI